MTETTLTRRRFGQLVVAFGVGLSFDACAAAAAEVPLSPQWWLELHRDGRIRMLTKHVEMGQGAHTGLRTLVAEELDVEPESIEIVQVPSDPKYGEIITGGSFTLAGWQVRVRRAAATARHMLLRAASQQWRAPMAELTTHRGFIEHGVSGRRGAYRTFVAAAADIPAPAPESVALKPRSAWRYIGKSTAIAHHESIVAGTAKYGIDVRLPGMCFAMLERAPVHGARLVEFDDSDARRTPGFIKTVALSGNAWPSHDHCRDAVAVVAENSWAAQQARNRVRITWGSAAASNMDTASIFEVFEKNVATAGVLSLERGDVDAAARHGGVRLESYYRQPYLAHAPLEPPNATAQVTAGRVEVWCGTQRQTRLRDAIALALGIAPEHVVVRAELIGGSFGRRLEVDYGVEAAKLARALSRPVQVLWTRTDDLRFGPHRSGSVHRLAASLDRAGRMACFEHRYAAESVLRQQLPSEISGSGADWTLAAPLVSLPYEVANVRLEHHAIKPMTPCAWWRGTYWTNVTTAVECFIDELAEHAEQDPLAFRLAHLTTSGRREVVVNESVRTTLDARLMRGVLEAVAAASGWNQPAPAGHARGIACGMYDAPECYAAVVVEACLRDDAPMLVSAFVAVDVGTVVNPQIVRSQAMGGFVMGASAALRESIMWRQGQVEQDGFAEYSIMRLDECPRVEVILVPSDRDICGVGEIVTPAAIAAVTNAVSRLGHRRIRAWPIK